MMEKINGWRIIVQLFGWLVCISGFILMTLLLWLVFFSRLGMFIIIFLLIFGFSGLYLFIMGILLIKLKQAGRIMALLYFFILIVTLIVSVLFLRTWEGATTHISNLGLIAAILPYLLFIGLLFLPRVKEQFK